MKARYDKQTKKGETTIGVDIHDVLLISKAGKQNHLLRGPRLIPIEVSSRCGRIDPEKVSHVRSQCGQNPRKILPSTIPGGDGGQWSGRMSDQTCGRIFNGL